MGMLEDGAAWMAEQIQSHASRNIRYRRGQDAIETTAVVGESQLDADGGDGAMIRYELRDYLIRASTLLLDDVPLLPENGDQIDDLLLEKTFEVFAPRQHDCFTYVDTAQLTMRVHVQNVT